MVACRCSERCGNCAEPDAHGMGHMPFAARNSAAMETLEMDSGFFLLCQ